MKEEVGKGHISCCRSLILQLRECRLRKKLVQRLPANKGQCRDLDPGLCHSPVQAPQEEQGRDPAHRGHPSGSTVPGRGLTYITHQDIAIILTGKPRLREVKRCAQGHTVSSFQCPDPARPGQTLFFLLRSAASLLTRQTLPEP